MSQEIERDADWLPHRIDWNAGTITFLKIAKDAYLSPGFLADHQPAAASDQAELPLSELAELAPETGPLHFIFHTAFCRSTLLSKALNIPGVSAGLSEPGIFASLAGGGDRALPFVKQVAQLLARKRSGGEAVFVKPSNHSNALIPHFLQAVPQARAILMSNPLKTFLSSVARKGMHGRRWGRNLFLELQAYAGMDFGMNERELFCISDMQAAGLAWFLNQNYFHALTKSALGERLRVLDGDEFNRHRASAIKATLDFTGTSATDAQIDAAATGPAFAAHAKLGGGFNRDAAEAPPRIRQRDCRGHWSSRRMDRPGHKANRRRAAAETNAASCERLIALHGRARPCIFTHQEHIEPFDQFARDVAHIGRRIGKRMVLTPISQQSRGFTLSVKR
ncbi:hypothetical protein MTsPCn3_19950 [Erythrobacter sp. MTPC3]